MSVAFTLNLMLTIVAFSGVFANVENHFHEWTESHHRAKRIAGGENAPRDAYPWYVLITRQKTASEGRISSVNNTSLSGSGSLINDKWVLTNAAVDGYNRFDRADWIIMLGVYQYTQTSKDLNRRTALFRPEKIIRHEKHDSATFAFDVALIKLGKRLKVVGSELVEEKRSRGTLSFTKHIQPVTLPSCSSDWQTETEGEKSECVKEASLYEPGSDVIIIGHGFTSSHGGITAKYLQQTDLTLLSDMQCRADLPTLVRFMKYTKEMFCARSDGVKSDCFGDAGAPAMRKVPDLSSGKNILVQIGIVSWGLGCPGTEKRRGREIISPSYFTKVSAVLNWIRNKTGPYNPCPDLPPLKNTIIKVDKGIKLLSFRYSVGTQIDLECQSGYEAIGALKPITCLPNGEWSGDVSVCSDKKAIFSEEDRLKPEEQKTVKVDENKSCPSFTLPEYTVMRVRRGRKLQNSTYSVGTKIDFNCKAGYKGFGNPEPSTCLANGNWSGRVPVCFEALCKQDPSKVEEGETCKPSCNNYADCPKIFEWCLCDSHCGRTCYDPTTICPEVAAPENGTVVVGSGRVGSIAKYVCDDGFFLSGSEVRKCTSRGLWSGQSPTCLTVSKQKAECGQAGDVRIRPSKVVGGSDAAPAAWPWQVAIYLTRFSVRGTLSQIQGGGSIINNKWILTAAHVFGTLDRIFKAPKKYQNWERYTMVGLGITERPFSTSTVKEGVLFYEVSNIHRHEKYKSRVSMDYDIAMIQVGHRLIASDGIFVVDSEADTGIIPFSKYIRPVCLPCLSSCTAKKYPCEKLVDGLLQEAQTREFGEVIVTGFSEFGNSGLWLQQGSLTIEKNAECKRGSSLMIGIAEEDVTFTSRMMCAKSKVKSAKTDACKGDSGGPLVRRVRNADGSSCWMQVGIISWGDSCMWIVEAGSRVPGYYANVSFFIPWIKKLIDSNE